MNRSRPRPQRSWSAPLLALLLAGLAACPAVTKTKGDGEHGSLFSEFLIVHYEQDRTVLIDGQPRGATGELLAIERGVHLIALEGLEAQPRLAREVVVENTTPVAPLEIDFNTLGDGAQD